MKKRQYLYIGFFTVLSVLTLTFFVFNDHFNNKRLKYQRIYCDDYQNFIKNWDDIKYPVLYALIETPEQYDEIFQSASVMGRNKPYILDPKIYKEQSMILVSRVTAPIGREQQDKTFIIENIMITNDKVNFSYQFNEPEPGTSLSKECLAVLIPKGDYKTIVIVENGKQIGELFPNEGKWVNITQ